MSFAIKNVFVAVIITVVLSCQRQVRESDLSHLNGYWEISKVIKSDGSEKEYKINETIDLFQLKGKEGFRKKVKPQFDGGYLETGQAEAIAIVVEDGKTFLEYKTPYASWKEEILAVSPDEIVLKTKDNAEYHYKKAVPFNIK